MGQVSGLDWRQHTEWDADVNRLTTLVGRVLAAGRDEDGRRARLLKAHMPTGAVLEGRRGVEVVGSFLSAVEGQLAAILKRCDGLTTFAGLRRLSRRLWVLQHYDPRGSQTRGLAELAAVKWARWRRVQNNPDRNQFRWFRSDANDIGRVLLLAEAYEAGAAMRRRLAKGQALTVTDATVIEMGPVGEDSTRLDALIGILDARRMTDPAPLAFLGQVSITDDVGGPVVLVAEWRPVDDLVSQGVGALIDPDPQGDPWQPLPAHDLQCWWGNLTGTTELLEATEHLRGWLHDRHGCAPMDVVMVLHLLSEKVREQIDAEPYGPERLWRYGFACAEWPAVDEFSRLPEIAVDVGLPGADAVTSATLAAAAVVVQAAPETCALDNPLHTRPIIRMGDWFAYDVLSTYGLFQSLWADARADPRAEGEARRRLEAQAHKQLGQLGRQPWPQGKKIRHEGRDITDIDASVVIGDTLVAADCYSSHWTSALDRGDHAATRNRVQHVRDKLAAWDATWERIAAGKGRASLPLTAEGVKQVLPVVVSAMPEWLDRDLREEPGLWLDPSTPRILTVSELARLLSTTDPSALPHAFPVS